MVYINLRLNVADYDRWRAVFDGMDPTRKGAGSTGVNQVYRDVDNANNVTLVLEWDNAANAKSFLANPKLKEAMDAAGVTGAPMVAAVETRM